MSKLVQREACNILRARRRGRISKILEDFKGLRYITGIKTHVKRELIGSMEDAAGNVCVQRDSIANVFADFYEGLYSLRDVDDFPIYLAPLR